MEPKKSNQSWLLYIYLFVPLLSSVISTFHLYDFVRLANNSYMALALAFTFELGSIVSFITLSPNMLNKIKKGYILTIFMILFALQAIGNVYAGFDSIRAHLINDPKWLDSFMEMSMGMLDLTTAKLTISILIGLPIPIISLIMLKSAVDQIYMTEQTAVLQPELTNTETVKPEPIVETKQEAKQESDVKHAILAPPAPELQETKSVTDIEETDSHSEIYNKEASGKMKLNPTLLNLFRLRKK